MSFERIKDTDTADVALYDKVNGMFNAMYYGEKSNCITEIPQDIKLELNDGTLTLKAGSKVYVPNGAGVFNAITITTDVSATRTDSQDCMVWYYSDGRLGIFPKVLLYSGTTAPTQYQFMYWYDTTENKCKVTSDFGATWAAGLSFPIAIVATDGTKISKIKQVFNGFGYVGSTVFALPGVKGLIPNGRNEDGSLKNIEFVNPAVRTLNVSGTYKHKLALAVSGLGAYIYAYDEIKNAIYRTDTGAYYNADRLIVGDVSYTNGVITSFQSKTPFHAVDYNEFEKLDNEVVKTTGNQTITDKKTFTSVNGLAVVAAGNNNIIMKNTDVNISESTRPSTYTNALIMYDKNDAVCGIFGVQTFTTGITRSIMQARNKSTGTNVTGEISISVDENGSVYTNAPTPASATSNSLAIATTAWCTNASKDGNLFGAPNYAGVVSWSGTGKKTASSNGILHVYRTGQACNFVAKINDVVDISIGRNGNSYWDDVSSQFLLKKGDYVNITEFNGSNVKVYFIPCL